MELLLLFRGMYSSAEIGPAIALHAAGKHLQNASQLQTCQTMASNADARAGTGKASTGGQHSHSGRGGNKRRRGIIP
jgi:hypothetical protein